MSHRFFLQFCTVVNDSTMTCLAPGLIYSKPNPPEGALRPDEFGFIFDQVTQSALKHYSRFSCRVRLLASRAEAVQLQG